MPRKSTGASVGRLWKAAASADWTSKAKQAADTLKAEYDAGRRGEEGPSAVLWASPKGQVDALLAIMRGTPGPEAAASGADGVASTDEPSGDSNDGDTRPDAAADEELDAREVASALRGVDWSKVKDAVSDTSGNAARMVKSMTAQVDWDKLQPVAKHVSSAVITAVASGQLPVGGPVSRKVARTMLNQGGLAQKVAGQLKSSAGSGPLAVPDMQPIIEATGLELGPYDHPR